MPRPEPANVPPPTASDYQDSTPPPSVPDAPKAAAKTLAKEPVSAEAAPAAEGRDRAVRRRDQPPRRRTDGSASRARQSRPATAAPPPRRRRPPPSRRRTSPRSPPRPRATSPPPISRSPTSCATCSAAKTSRYFDRKGERAAVEKFYAARDYAPLWTQGGSADRSRQGRDRAPQGRRSRRPQRRRLSGAGFRRRHHAGRAGRSRAEADRQHARLCAPGAERPHALVAGVRPTSCIPSTRPIRPKCSPMSRRRRTPPPRSTATTRRRRSIKELKTKLAELRGESDGPVQPDRRRPGAEIQPARRKKKPTAAVMDDPRVPQLRAKLGITENADDTNYDATVAEAVRKFQDERRSQGDRRARRRAPCAR